MTALVLALSGLGPRDAVAVALTGLFEALIGFAAWWNAKDPVQAGLDGQTLGDAAGPDGFGARDAPVAAQRSWLKRLLPDWTPPFKRWSLADAAGRWLFGDDGFVEEEPAAPETSPAHCAGHDPWGCTREAAQPAYAALPFDDGSEPDGRATTAAPPPCVLSRADAESRHPRAVETLSAHDGRVAEWRLSPMCSRGRRRGLVCLDPWVEGSGTDAPGRAPRTRPARAICHASPRLGSVMTPRGGGRAGERDIRMRRNGVPGQTRTATLSLRYHYEL